MGGVLATPIIATINPFIHPSKHIGLFGLKRKPGVPLLYVVGPLQITEDLPDIRLGILENLLKENFYPDTIENDAFCIYVNAGGEYRYYH